MDKIPLTRIGHIKIKEQLLTVAMIVAKFLQLIQLG